MARKRRQTGRWYSVDEAAYVDEATRARVERGEEVITQPAQFTAQP